MNTTLYMLPLHFTSVNRHNHSVRYFTMFSILKMKNLKFTSNAPKGLSQKSELSSCGDKHLALSTPLLRQERSPNPACRFGT